MVLNAFTTLLSLAALNLFVLQTNTGIEEGFSHHDAESGF